MIVMVVNIVPLLVIVVVVVEIVDYADLHLIDIMVMALCILLPSIIIYIILNFPSAMSMLM